MTTQNGVQQTELVRNGQPRLPATTVPEIRLPLTESSIHDILEHATTSPREVLESVRDIIADVEARLDFNETITITKQAVQRQIVLHLEKDRRS